MSITGKNVQQQALVCIAGRIQSVTIFILEDSCQFLTKLNKVLLNDAVNVFLGIYPTDFKMYVHT